MNILFIKAEIGCYKLTICHGFQICSLLKVRTNDFKLHSYKCAWRDSWNDCFHYTKIFRSSIGILNAFYLQWASLLADTDRKLCGIEYSGERTGGDEGYYYIWKQLSKGPRIHSGIMMWSLGCVIILADLYNISYLNFLCINLSFLHSHLKTCFVL